MEWSINGSIITIDISEKEVKCDECPICKRTHKSNHTLYQVAEKALDFLKVDKNKVCKWCVSTFNTHAHLNYKAFIQDRKEYLDFKSNWEKENKAKEKIFNDSFFIYELNGFKIMIYKVFSKQEICKIKYVFRKMIRYEEYHENFGEHFMDYDSYHEMNLFAKNRLPKLKNDFAIICNKAHEELERTYYSTDISYHEKKFLEERMVNDKEFIEFFAIDRLSKMIIRKSKDYTLD